MGFAGYRVALAAACAVLGIGCQSAPKHPLVAPSVTVAPYDSTRGEVLWAVVPLRNDSGTTVVDPLAVSDKLVAAVEEVRGLRAVPLNRTIQTMNALKLRGVSSPAEARQLAQAMGVDAVLVGAITAYDPYAPTIGLSLGVFERPGAMQPRSSLDIRTLQTQATEGPGAAAVSDAPIASFSEHLDGKNNQVLMDVKAYAEGRVDGPSALGWRRYTASADLFAEFAAHHAVGGLMRQEWLRVGNAPPAVAEDGQPVQQGATEGRAER